ncbi:MAG: hypothetical protein II871_05325 [Clostridia bacterium]|nr:hypothetical protein [Clostridia bacterium]
MEMQRKNSRIDFVSGYTPQPSVIEKENGYGGSEHGEGTDASVKLILSAAPARMEAELKRLLDPSMRINVEEIRFRVGRPIQLIASCGEVFLPQFGRFSRNEAEKMLNALCGNSIYTKLNELELGFISLPGGARVGVCGAPVIENGKIIRFTSIDSFNVRIPRELRGCAEKSIHHLVRNGRPASSLIFSAPGIGKTTFLRDCARCFSNGIAGVDGIKVAIADERCELSGGAFSSLDIGIRTDAISGVPKLISIPMLIRNMSPQLIVTDELSGKAEAQLIEEASKCGIAIIASAHAGSIEQIRSKAEFSDMIGRGRINAFLLDRIGGELVLSEAFEEREAEWKS